MATIAFLIDDEEGHILPTFKLARRLAARGHRIVYLGVADCAEAVERQGFELAPILERLFPKGSLRISRALGQRTGEPLPEAGQLPRMRDGEPFEQSFAAIASGEALDEVVGDLKPDLFLVSSFYCGNALAVRYRYRRPVVLLTPHLRSFPKDRLASHLEGWLLRSRRGTAAFMALVEREDPTVRSFRDVCQRVLEMRELILCPGELELPEWRKDREREVFYVEPSVDLERREPGSFPWERLDPARRTLYCSFGSQMETFSKPRYLDPVVEALKDRPGWQVVLSTGRLLAPEQAAALPAGFFHAPWVPQLEMLRRADVILTHAGLGTVKECLLHGVPMAVYRTNDIAQRIIRHGLGVEGDLETFRPEDIWNVVRRAAEDPGIRGNVERMRQAVLPAEESGPSVPRIEELLDGRREAGHG